MAFYIDRKMKRSSFVFYDSFHAAAQFLDREEKLLVYEMIVEYGIAGNIIQNDNRIINSIFSLIKPQLDANNKKFIDGCAGGRPQKDWQNSQKPQDTKKITTGVEEKKPNVNDNVNDNDNGAFEKFWDVYPLKKGKQKAKENFAKAIKITNPEIIIEGAAKYAEECRANNTERIKYPEGWLTDKRREDEIKINTGGEDYENIQTFHNARKAEKIDDIKKFFQKKYGEARLEKYQNTKRERTKNPLYAELFK